MWTPCASISHHIRIQVVPNRQIPVGFTSMSQYNTSLYKLLWSPFDWQGQHNFFRFLSTREVAEKTPDSILYNCCPVKYRAGRGEGVIDQLNKLNQYFKLHWNTTEIRIWESRFCDNQGYSYLPHAFIHRSISPLCSLLQSLSFGQGVQSPWTNSLRKKFGLQGLPRPFSVGAASTGLLNVIIAAYQIAITQPTVLKLLNDILWVIRHVWFSLTTSVAGLLKRDQTDGNRDSAVCQLGA